MVAEQCRHLFGFIRGCAGLGEQRGEVAVVRIGKVISNSASFAGGSVGTEEPGRVGSRRNASAWRVAADAAGMRGGATCMPRKTNARIRLP
jgi:hypothetical protein